MQRMNGVSLRNIGSRTHTKKNIMGNSHLPLELGVVVILEQRLNGQKMNIFTMQRMLLPSTT